MALNAAAVTASGDEVGPTALTTARVAPTANALQLLQLTYWPKSGGALVDPTSMTGNGLTWVRVGVAAAENYNGESHSLWRAQAASPSTGTLVITMPTQQYVLGATWVEFTGAVVGNNGADAILNVKQADGNSVTLDALASANNAAFGVVCNYGGNSPGVGSGYTDLGTWAGTNYKTRAEWKLNETAVGFTSLQYAYVFGLEVVAAAASGAADRGMPRGMSGGMSSFSGGMLGYRKASRSHIFVPELPRGMGWKRGLIRGLSGGMS
jgi:hypothetical protein